VKEVAVNTQRLSWDVVSRFFPALMGPGRSAGALLGLMAVDAAAFVAAAVLAMAMPDALETAASSANGAMDFRAAPTMTAPASAVTHHKRCTVPAID
jgi:hypothetical protein